MICPECRNGKHVNCTVQTLNQHGEWVACACNEPGHPRRVR